jgi:hypothetical protein
MCRTIDRSGVPAPARARRKAAREHDFARVCAIRAVIEIRVGFREQPWMVIRGAAEHDSIDVFELTCDGVVRGDASVGHDSKRGEIALEPVHVVVLERRHLAVLLGRESLEHGVAGVRDERAGARLRDRPDEVANEAVFLDLVDADAVLDGDRHVHRVAHRCHALRHQRGLAHQTRAEAAGLHALTDIPR